MMNDQRLYGTLQKKRESKLIQAPAGSKGTEVTSSNKLLAGYMAYEFRTKGRVLGQKLEDEKAENERYKEITSLLMMREDGGVHIPGVVNPAQLARWINM